MIEEFDKVNFKPKTMIHSFKCNVNRKILIIFKFDKNKNLFYSASSFSPADFQFEFVLHCHTKKNCMYFVSFFAFKR